MTLHGQAVVRTQGLLFGYDNVHVRTPEGRRVERRLNPVEAAVIRRLFEWAAAGWGTHRMAHTLNAEGVAGPRHRRGMRPVAWIPPTIAQMLRRPAYRGTIVPEACWDTVQAELTRRRRGPPDATRDPDIPATALADLSRITAFQYVRYWRRFQAYQAAEPGAPLLDQVLGFLHQLSRAARRPALLALRRILGRDALPWRDAVRLRRVHRNEPVLRATLLAPTERARLLGGLEGRPRALALIHSLWTLRRAEVARLRWEHLDLDRGQVAVPKGKGDKPALTLLPGEAVAAFRAWHVEAGAPEIGFVFSRRYHPERGVKPDTVGTWVAELLQSAGLARPRRGAHAFRRTFGTLYLQSNPEDLVGLQHLLRHEDLATTARYVFYDLEDLAPRVARVRLVDPVRVAAGGAR